MWALADREDIQLFDTADEAIEAYLEDIEITNLNNQDIGELVVEEYQQAVIDPNLCNPLDDLLEYFDDEYGDPDNRTEPTPAMKEAEDEFINKVIAEYDVWRYDTTGTTVKVNALDWMKEHRPDWLK